MKIFNSKLAEDLRLLKFGRVAAPLIALLVTIAMLIASSVAWFTNNRNLDSNDMDMALAVDDTQAIYEAYKFDIDNMVGVDEIENEAGELEKLDISNLDLNQYDTIFSVQNQYTPAFAKIKITRNTTMDWNGTVYVTITRDSTVDGLEADGKLTERISSILRFTAVVDPTANTITDPNDLYTHINEACYDDVSKYKETHDHSTTFVSVHGEGEGHTHLKADSITVGVDYTESDWYLDSDGCYKLNVYLYMSYDVQLIECYIDEHSGDKLDFNDTVYEFDNDLDRVAVSYINAKTSD